MLIKVCGMREPQNIAEVADLGIDFMGFIFWSKSPRAYNAVDEKPLIKHSFDFHKVGVFVNASVKEMIETASEYHLQYLQLHGNESAQDCLALHKKGFGVIKAFSIASETDLQKTNDYIGSVDYFLFDTKCNTYGGSGKQFDWNVLANYRGRTPFFLSGGINPDSEESIRKFNHPSFAGIDLNSGFELSPGLKDVNKLRKFITSLK